ncbi:MAG: hypothetical protein H0T66_16055 [Geodermatophilaceae bacterium]|jgi:uncharacterized membrane protein (UPF0136 family)|nr:hypothetical protein [Geodermatophilaceae bacterium]MDQ3457490.1 hypothetical protein [Actinomycetota bacterium]
MKAVALLLSVLAGLGGILGYVLTGEVLLLALAGVGVVLASGGYVLSRGNPRRW